jgi:polyhydroxyalkanoate synthase
VDTDIELSEVMRSVAEKSLRLLTSFKQQPPLPILLEKYIDFSNDFHSLFIALLNHPEKLKDMQFAYWQDAIGLLQENLEHWLKGTTKPASDKRFSSDEWVSNPFFSLLSQQYLLASEHLKSLLGHLDYGDKQLAKRIQFFMRQYLDAISPDNFFHTNPQLIAETIQSHGKNLLLGLENLLSDLEAGSSRLIIKMADMDAFKPGDNIAVTPGKVIFKNELIELIQYTPQTPKVQSVPLLIIPPWINKYYILDLSPHNSFIRWLVTKGITVFAISWVNPDERFVNKGIFDYLNDGPIAAITAIQTQLCVKKVNILGFCIGGTLSAMLLAYYKARNEAPIQSATFLASMIDFSDPGDIAVYIDENQIAKLEERMNRKGYLEGHFMASAFNSLRASDLIWSFFIKHYLRGKTPVPFDILYWNADSTNMPAKMHSEYLRWMYLHNYLVQPGKILLNHTPLDVKKIDVPTFFVSTQKDHIAPWQTTYLGFQLMKGKKCFLLGGSGHIAGIIVPPGSHKYGYYRNAACPRNPKDWLANATHHPGSWWPEWFRWLKKQSGHVQDAPDFNRLPLTSLMDAPGSYVHIGSQKESQAVNTQHV